MSKLSTFAAFIFGAATGALVTWKVLKTKYEQIAQEEIDSVKETFSERLKEIEEEPGDEDEEDDSEKNVSKSINTKPDIFEYAKTIKDNGYSKDESTDDEEDELSYKKPYVISQDEFGENDDYETVTLYYYEDDVLTDDNDNIIKDVDELVGLDSLTRFGEYEDDSVFVRDDGIRTDYEILKDSRKYHELNEG